jgi:hypothetical protein
MTNAPVAADVHEALDIHRDFSAQGAFDAKVLLDRLPKLVGISIGEIANALLGVDASRLENSSRQSAPDPEDVRQADLDLLLTREIHPSNTSHELTLLLLVLWIALADDASHALSFDDLAVLTNRLDAAANFHVQLPTRWAKRAEALQKTSRLAFENT